jgi:hypothetical protein
MLVTLIIYEEVLINPKHIKYKNKEDHFLKLLQIINIFFEEQKCFAG